VVLEVVLEVILEVNPGPVISISSNPKSSPKSRSLLDCWLAKSGVRV
jgi:hypothetical protein